MHKLTRGESRWLLQSMQFAPSHRVKTLSPMTLSPFYFSLEQLLTQIRVRRPQSQYYVAPPPDCSQRLSLLTALLMGKYIYSCTVYTVRPLLDVLYIYILHFPHMCRYKWQMVKMFWSTDVYGYRWLPMFREQNGYRCRCLPMFWVHGCLRIHIYRYRCFWFTDAYTGRIMMHKVWMTEIPRFRQEIPRFQSAQEPQSLNMRISSGQTYRPYTRASVSVLHHQAGWSKVGLILHVCYCKHMLVVV